MLRITLGTYGNILRNMMRMALNILGNMLETHWEHCWKHEFFLLKIELCNPIPPRLKGKRWALMGACLAISLAA